LVKVRLREASVSMSALDPGAQRGAARYLCKKTPNAQRPTSNAQFRASIPQFDVQRSMFGVRCLLLPPARLEETAPCFVNQAQNSCSDYYRDDIDFVA
jgi:hypothetical protein